jgi:hypothetical protein
MDDAGFGREREIFLFLLRTSKSSLGPTEPFFNVYWFFLLGGGRGPEYAVDHKPPLNAKVMN